MRNLIRALMVTMTLLALPGLAGAQTAQAVATDSGEARVMLAAFPTDLHGMQSMPMAQAGAIIGGAVVGAMLTDVVLGGGLFTVAGVLLGAVAGNTMFERHYWPF
jgi:hypothetical protein